MFCILVRYISEWVIKQSCVIKSEVPVLLKNPGCWDRGGVMDRK